MMATAEKRRIKKENSLLTRVEGRCRYLFYSRATYREVLSLCLCVHKYCNNEVHPGRASHSRQSARGCSRTLTVAATASRCAWWTASSSSAASPSPTCQTAGRTTAPTRRVSSLESVFHVWLRFCRVNGMDRAGVLIF